MSEWKNYQLAKVTEVIFSGGTPSTKEDNYWGGEFPWFSSGETRNDFIYDTEKRITREGIDNSSTRLAYINDVVIASAGQGHTRGQASICKIDTYINQSVVAIRSNKNLLDSYFLFYNIKNRYNELRQISDGFSSRGSLTTKLIKELEISLPPLPTQRRIAAILSTLDDKIENNRRICEKLEEMAQAIFKQWFVDFNFPDENGEPYKDNGGEMVESELGLIPKGWECSTLGQSSSYLSRGIAPKYTEEKSIPVINQKCIRNSKINFDLCRYHKGKCNDIKFLQFGDVLINSTGKGTLGRVAQFYSQITNLTVDSHVTIIRPNSSCSIEFFGYLLSNMERDFEYAGSGSTGQTELGRKVVSSMPIILPYKRIDNMFSNIIMPIKNQINKLSSQNIILTNIRDTLLPKLMSGEIDVEEVQ